MVIDHYIGHSSCRALAQVKGFSILSCWCLLAMVHDYFQDHLMRFTIGLLENDSFAWRPRASLHDFGRYVHLDVAYLACRLQLIKCLRAWLEDWYKSEAGQSKEINWYWNAGYHKCPRWKASGYFTEGWVLRATYSQTKLLICCPYLVIVSPHLLLISGKAEVGDWWYQMQWSSNWTPQAEKRYLSFPSAHSCQRVFVETVITTWIATSGLTARSICTGHLCSFVVSGTDNRFCATALQSQLYSTLKLVKFPFLPLRGRFTSHTTPLPPVAVGVEVKSQPWMRHVMA